MLHGGGGTPEHTGAHELDKYGDSKGFIIVYPEGLNRGWNDGRPIKDRTSDDVGFLSALVDELVAKYNADAKRVYSSPYVRQFRFFIQMDCFRVTRNQEPRNSVGYGPQDLLVRL